MSSLPKGTVTFLFTDIENSTPLWEQYPEEMKSALAKHDALLKETIEKNNGQIIKTTGDGFHAVFSTAIDAVKASLDAQRNFQTSEVSETSEVSLRVRMGLHTGEAELRDGDYYGSTLNRAARIMSIGHGGQILLSETTLQISREHLSENINVLDLGQHQLKGLSRTETIYQISLPDLQQEFPALKSLMQATNNLPTQLTSFIGRERELAEAKSKLENARLLTLIGPGGTGKTRLSVQIATDQLGNFKDGVWLVELAPISDSNLINTTIASVFDLREVQDIPISTILIDFLRAKNLLLILDNCEHIVEASAEATDQILQSCPGLKVLASSREALGIDGETVYRVPSLKENEAIRLFADRATKAEPRFELTDENALHVTQICSRLDGIPLAIELAAARVKMFTPRQIAERLDDRFKLLTGGSRTALPRQQTLRALIDWSYQSLNEVEQRALRHLAVFSGGWLFEAAESVIGGDEAMEGLLGLVNKSLVNVEEKNSLSRYRFLETIRQYAMEKLLESGEAAEIRNRFLDHVLKMAESSSLGLFSSEIEEHLDIFEADHDNIRSALKWALENHPDKALQLIHHVGSYWSVRDHNTEAIQWCSAALNKTENTEGLDMERARVYIVLGWSCVTTGDHRQGRAASEQAMKLGQKTNDPSTVARAYGTLALACVFLGDYSTAYQAAEEGDAYSREHGLRNELAFILASRSQMAYTADNDIVKAKQYLEEAEKLSREEGFRWAYSFSAYGLARVAGILGDMETARAQFARSEEIARQMGNNRIIYSSQSELAHILREHGELEEALQTYINLLPKWKDLGHRSAVAHELECIAFILIKKGNHTNAVKLLGAAEGIREDIDSSMTKFEEIEYQKEISFLQAAMDKAAFEQLWEEGKQLKLNDAIEFATNL